MRAMRALTAFAVLAVVSVSSIASAEIECPPGTTRKSDGPDVWCEPSVCSTDAQCGAGEVCKAVPLCVEIGQKKSAAGDAGQLLMARQKCGPDKGCPASTTCLTGTRCLARVEAEKMGLLDAPAGSATAGASPSGGKKACGCSTPGAPAGGLGALAAAALAGAIAVRRRARSAH